MTNKETQTVDEYLKKEGFGKKPKKQKNKKSKKGLFVAIAAILLAVLTALGITALVKKLKKKGNNEPQKTAITDTVLEKKEDLDNMGIQLPFANENENENEKIPVVIEDLKEGDFNPQEIVQVPDKETNEPKIYVNEEAAKNTENIGVVIDTKDDTLIVDDNGTVKEIEEGYEYIDPNTGVTVTGEGDIPDGYKEVEPGVYIKEEDLKDIVLITETIYSSEGILYNVGEYVTKEGYDRVLDYINKGILSYTPITTQEVVEVSEVVDEETVLQEVKTEVDDTTTLETPTVEESIEEKEETPVIEEGVINPDGTYTIYGLTFETKEDYEQWVIQEYEGYDLVDGIMMSTEARLAYEKTLNR